MSEAAFERRLLWLGFAALLVAPFLLLGSWTPHWPASPKELPDMAPPIFLIWFGSLPLAMLLGMLAGSGSEHGLRFFVENPSAEATQGTRSGSVTMDDVRARIESLFDAAIEEEEGERRISFAVVKSGLAYRFLNHAFEGEVELAVRGSGDEIRSRITQHDTLLLETGEMRKLQQIADYLAFKAEGYREEDLSLLLVSGWSIGALSLPLSALAAFEIVSARWFVAASTGAFAMIVTSLLLALGSRISRGSAFDPEVTEGRIGSRLAMQGLGLAALAFLPLLRVLVLP